MNKKTVIASLNEIANELDNTGFYSEANRVTQMMIKLSQAEMPESDLPEDAEAQQGGFFDQAQKFTQKIFGAPKYPGTPQQKANFERDFPGKWGSFRYGPLTPAQKTLMSQPGEHLGVRFLDPKLYGEEVAFWFTITRFFSGVTDKGWLDILNTFMDDRKLRYYLSKPDSEHTKHESVQGGMNPKNAMKDLLVSIRLPSSDEPKVVADWIKNSPAKRYFIIGTDDGGAISFEQDLAHFSGLSFNKRSIIGAMEYMITTEYGAYGSTASSGQPTPKNTERFSRNIKVLRPIADELINNPEVIAVKNKLQEILYGAKLKAEKNPLSKLPFRLPKL